MIPILIPSPWFARLGPPDLRRADHAGARDRASARYADAGVDPANPREGRQSAERALRDDHGRAVEDEPVPPADAGAGDGVVQRRREARLLPIHPSAGGSAARSRAACHGRRREGDDDLAAHLAHRFGHSLVRDGAAGRGEAAEPDGAEKCENAVHDGYDADAAGRLPCSMPECGVAAKSAGAGCGGIGRRARFRSVCLSGRGGSSPLIRIAGPFQTHRDQDASERHDPRWIKGSWRVGRSEPSSDASPENGQFRQLTGNVVA